MEFNNYQTNKYQLDLNKDGVQLKVETTPDLGLTEIILTNNEVQHSIMIMGFDLLEAMGRTENLSEETIQHYTMVSYDYLVKAVTALEKSERMKAKRKQNKNQNGGKN